MKKLFGKIKYYSTKISAIAGFYRKVIRYNTPNIFRPSQPISKSTENYLKDLREKGFFIMDEKFLDLAEYLNKEYFENFDEGEKQKKLFERHKIRDINTPDLKLTGNILSWYISFKDPRLNEIIFNEELCGLFYNFFRRQPYYRDSAHLTMDKFDQKVATRISSKYHLDSGVHQLSLILLLNDVTENDTHTLYAVGSNRKYRASETLDRFSFDDSVVEQSWTLQHLYGKKGTLLVIDAGNGYHKIVEKPNSVRKMLFINVTAGSDIKPNKLDTLSDWAELQMQKPFIRKMFSKTCMS